MDNYDERCVGIHHSEFVSLCLKSVLYTLYTHSGQANLQANHEINSCKRYSQKCCKTRFTLKSNWFTSAEFFFLQYNLSLNVLVSFNLTFMSLTQDSSSWTCLDKQRRYTRRNWRTIHEDLLVTSVLPLNGRVSDCFTCHCHIDELRQNLQ